MQNHHDPSLRPMTRHDMQINGQPLIEVIRGLGVFYEIHPDLTEERLTFLARLIRSVRADAVDAHDADKGDDHVWEAIICSRTKSIQYQ